MYTIVLRNVGYYIHTVYYPKRPSSLVPPWKHSRRQISSALQIPVAVHSPLLSVCLMRPVTAIASTLRHPHRSHSCSLICWVSLGILSEDILSTYPVRPLFRCRSILYCVISEVFLVISSLLCPFFSQETHFCWYQSAAVSSIVHEPQIYSKSGLVHVPYKQTNSVALSPQANCTGWATATCRRNVVPTFLWIEGCRVVSAADPARSLISVF
jgi:hypothetical protein